MAGVFSREERRDLSEGDNYILVAAIDLGTTFSGYAFSFRHKPNEINMNKTWGAELGTQSFKVPTCVMTNPDGSFHSFGYQAEECYHNLDPETQPVKGAKSFNIYRNFKMHLYNEVVNLSSKVTSSSNHSCDAIDIFTMAIRYLKDHMLEQINISLISGIETSQIRWVLTIPAIWNDQSKFFMREAAYRAGLISEKESENLILALEPETASIYCRSPNATLVAPNDSHPDEAFNLFIGDTGLVIDAGGGTVDITCHQTDSEGKLREIIEPSGGPWGGTTVDKEFIALLKKVIGSDNLDKITAEEPQQWLQVMLQFEKAKKAFLYDGRRHIRVFLPHGSLSLAMNKAQQENEEVMGENNIIYRNGAIRIEQEGANELFRKSVKKIIEHVKNILSDEKLKDVKYVLLVGGFGDCKILQNGLQSDLHLKNIRLVIPSESQLAVLKGAVLYGHNSEKISTRVARYTYGIGIRRRFKEGDHEQCMHYIDEFDQKWCSNIFLALVEKGQVLQNQWGYTKQFVREKKTNIVFTIYRTDRRKVEYVNEPGLKEICTAKLKKRSSDEIEVTITFGSTELHFQATDNIDSSCRLDMSVNYFED